MATGATHERAAPRLDTTWGDATQVLDLTDAAVDTVGSRARAPEGEEPARVLSRDRARTRRGKIKSCSCAIVSSTTWHGTSPQFKTHCLPRLRLSSLDVSRTCLRGDECVRPTCLRDVSSHAHVSSRRRGSSPDLSSGSVFARPCVFATTRVFARHVFACPRVFATTRVLARPVLGACLRTPCVFATMRVLARPVFKNCLRPPTCVFAKPGFGKCLRPPTCLRDDACPRPTCFRNLSPHAHVSSRQSGSSPDLSSATVFSRDYALTTGSAVARAVRSGIVFGRPRVFAPRSVFAGNVSSDAHVSWLSSPGMCLLRPRCLRRPCFEASVLDPTCFQNVSSVFGQYVHPQGDRNSI